MPAPQKGEIVTNYNNGLQLYGNRLLTNPDPIIQSRGGKVELYDELLRDDQIGPAFEQRRRATTQSEWDVEPGGNSADDLAAAEDLREQLDAIDFDAITDRMLYGLLHGYAVGEVLWGKKNNRVTIQDVKVRNRSRFRFDKDLKLRLINIHNPEGDLMPERKFWTLSIGGDTSDNPYGRGLGHSLFWPAFFKRNAVKFWMIYLDKFAMPTAIGRTPANMKGDEEQLNEVLQMLGAIQTDSAVTIPEDVQVELLEATRSGSADYSVIVERMDKAISKIVLSQTMTSDDGGSMAQAKIHKEVRDEVVKGDSDLVCASFNQTVVAWLTEWNHPGAIPPRVWRRTEPEADLDARAERDQKIMGLGYDPTEDYIEETYGPGWRLRKQSTTPPNPIGPLPEDFTEISSLASKRVAHRADQQRMADAAEALATKYPDLIGKRVEQILAFLDDTDDVETFRERLLEMITEPPNEAAVKAVRNASISSRLMGLLRGQRE